MSSTSSPVLPKNPREWLSAAIMVTFGAGLTAPIHAISGHYIGGHDVPPGLIPLGIGLAAGVAATLLFWSKPKLVAAKPIAVLKPEGVATTPLIMVYPLASGIASTVLWPRPVDLTTGAVVVDSYVVTLDKATTTFDEDGLETLTGGLRCRAGGVKGTVTVHREGKNKAFRVTLLAYGHQPIESQPFIDTE